MQITPASAADNGQFQCCFPASGQPLELLLPVGYSLCQPGLLLPAAPQLDVWNSATQILLPAMSGGCLKAIATLPQWSLTKQMAAQACCCQWQDFNTLWLSAE